MEKPAQSRPRETEKERRLAEALRENLRRRKGTAGTPPEPPTEDER